MNLFKQAIQKLQGKPKQDPFVANLIRQSAWSVKGAQAMVDYLEQPSKDNVLRIRRFEREADQTRRVMIATLNRTFVTPIDREDLFGLSRALDDVLDSIYATTREMYMLRVAPDSYIRRMTSILLRGTQELYMAIACLDQSPIKAEEHTARVRSLENRMHKLYLYSLVNLFDDPDQQNMINIIKIREIYRHTYQAIGRAERAANLVSDIVIKFY